MTCKICGDDARKDWNGGLKAPVRYWDSDDGWTIGRLCESCFEDARHAKPHPDDYAWNQRGEYVSDYDDALNQLCG